jgi:hypothetical protein
VKSELNGIGWKIAGEVRVAASGFNLGKRFRSRKLGISDFTFHLSHARLARLPIQCFREHKPLMVEECCNDLDFQDW